MPDLFCQTLPYRDGCLCLTDTHLTVVRGKYRSEHLALKHIADLALEDAHSFRHRFGGLIVGVGLFAIGIEMFFGGFNLLGFRGRIGMGAFFSVFFGIAFMVPVVASRRIWWMRLRYGNAVKLIPLAGADREAAERFADVINKAIARVP